MNAKEKMVELVQRQITEQLCEMYELLNNRVDTHSIRVRGMIMDELELRNPEAFNEWIDSNVPEEIVKPSLFFVDKP